jgi:hypothetical protein
MSKVIRVDEEVWAALKDRAEPLEDTPNDVLRRALGLGSRIPGRDSTTERVIERGHKVSSKAQLLKLLGTWLRSDEKTIGDVGSFGGKPWLYLELGSDTIQINADTNREGVERLLELNSQGNETWHVVPNSRGLPNKVTNDPSKRPIRGLYMYVNRPGQRIL